MLPALKTPKLSGVLEVVVPSGRVGPDARADRFALLAARALRRNEPNLCS